MYEIMFLYISVTLIAVGMVIFAHYDQKRSNKED